MKKGLIWIIKKNIALICACLLFIILYFYSFESFVGSSTISFVTLAEDSAVGKIEIACVRDIFNDTWINLADINIVDENDSPVQYWVSPNSVHFDNGDLGHQHTWGPVNQLYDGNPDTVGHSSTAPDKLTITLLPAKKLSSVQIANRKDCCELRITRYDLIFYNKDGKEIARKPLTNLGERAKSVTYILTKPTIKGDPGANGKDGTNGTNGVNGRDGKDGQKGEKGDKGDKGEKGEKGDQGLTGAGGAVGATGPTGPTGLMGPIGPMGPLGPAGPMGPAGPAGIQGPEGPVGPEGPEGPVGADGAEGPEGVARVNMIHKVIKSQ